MKPRLSLAVCLIAVLVSAGCVHKTGGATVTPMEKVTANNAVFAQVIQSIEKGAEDAVTAGVLKPTEAAPVIAWCGSAAQIDQQITLILSKGLTVSPSDYASLQDLVTQLKASADTLISSGSLGVKNSVTQQTITADINAALTIAQELLIGIQNLTATPAAPAPAPVSPTTGNSTAPGGAF